MNEVLLPLAAAALGWAVRHFFPNLVPPALGGQQPAPRPAGGPAPSSPARPPAAPQPQPQPQPRQPMPADPAVDRPLIDAMDWLTRARAGMLPVDAMDLRAIRAIKPMVDDLAAEPAPSAPVAPPPAPVVPAPAPTLVSPASHPVA